MNKPCLNKVADCLPCNDWPLENLSAELPDNPTYLGVVTVPPSGDLGGPVDPCFNWDFSEKSVQAAIDAAIAECSDTPIYEPVTFLSQEVTCNCTHLGFTYDGAGLTLPAGTVSMKVPTTAFDALPADERAEYVANTQAYIDDLALQQAIEQYTPTATCGDEGTVGCMSYGDLRPRVEYADATVKWLDPVAGGSAFWDYLFVLTKERLSGDDYPLAGYVAAGTACGFDNADFPGYHLLMNMYGNMELFQYVGFENKNQFGNWECVDDGPGGFPCFEMGCKSSTSVGTTKYGDYYYVPGPLLGGVGNPITIDRWPTSYKCGGSFGACPPTFTDGPIVKGTVCAVYGSNLPYLEAVPWPCWDYSGIAYLACLEENGLPQTTVRELQICLSYTSAFVQAVYNPTPINGSYFQTNEYITSAPTPYQEFDGTTGSPLVAERRWNHWTKTSGSALDPAGSYAVTQRTFVNGCGYAHSKCGSPDLYYGAPIVYGAATVTMEVPPP